MKKTCVLSLAWVVIWLLTPTGCSSGTAGGGGGKTSGGGSTNAAGSTSGTGGLSAGGGTTISSGGTGGATTAGSTVASGGSSAVVPSGGSTSSQAGSSATGGSSLGGAGGTRSETSSLGGSGSGGARTGGTVAGGTTATGGAGTGGGATGGGSEAGSTGTQGTGIGDAGTAEGVTCYTYPGVVKSPLYTVTVNGVSAPVEKFTKFSPEMQVHYAHCSVSGTANVSVTLSESASSYTLSPKSRNIASSKNGDTISFASGPNYLILAPSGKELLFILLDPPETAAPKVGDANVKSLADYDVDNTGATLVTSKVQSAINAASGATQNVLYVPPGKYKVGELWLKSDMTLYLAGGAILYGSGSTADFNTGSGGINIEGMQHSLVRMYQIKNTKLLGRGALDANGHAIRAAGLNASLLKIEQSSNITVDGIVSRDSSYWNTLIYRSDAVDIENYKVINCRPTTTTYNNTDGVDFDESTNGKLFNAFLYTGDDGMATKNEEASGVINTKDITHQKVVVYNNSVGCKVGTKSMGKTMDNIVFKDVDVVRGGRALTIEGYDTAVVSKTVFENIRVEAADIFIKLALDEPPNWREAANTSIYKDTYFTNVSSDANKSIVLHGKAGTSGTIDGVHFKGLTIQGKEVTSQTDADASWDIKNGVTNITFE